jgi:hypothetical protein
MRSNFDNCYRTDTTMRKKHDLINVRFFNNERNIRYQRGECWHQVADVGATAIDHVRTEAGKDQRNA